MAQRESSITTTATNERRSQPGVDVDQLCNLIDENTFGLQPFALSKLHSVPATQVKAFRSSRLKRLHTKANFSAHEGPSLPSSTYRTVSMRLSLPSSLLSRFRSLSTSNLPKARRYSTSALAVLPARAHQDDEVNAPLSRQSQLSCAIVDSRRATASSCTVEELAAYLDDFLYLPKSLSGAAELMYT